MTILQNVSVVNRRGISATFSGVLKRSGGTSLRNVFKRTRPASETIPPWSNCDSERSPRASSMILPRGIFTLKPRSRRKTMSRKSMDSAPRSSMSEASSFTCSTSQPSASAMISATFGKMAAISSFVMLLFVIMLLLHLKSPVHVQHLAGNVIGKARGQKPDGVGHVHWPANPPQEDAREHLVRRAFANLAGHFSFNYARRHRVDRNAARRQFDGQGARKSVDCAFAGGVIR